MTGLAEDLEAFVGRREVSAEQLDELWWSWFDDGFAARRGRDVFLDGIRCAEVPNARGELAFRLGGWQIDLGKTAAQVALVSGMLGGVLAVMGVPEVPVEVLPAVAPLVFDIRRSRLTKKQEYVLAELVVQPAVRQGMSADELYERLPESTRDDLSRADFEDFLDAARRAGLSTQADEMVVLAPKDQARFRVTFT